MSENKLIPIKTEVNETVKIMQNNIISIVERGDHLDNLHDRTTELEKQSASFRYGARQIKQKLCMENYKVMIIGSLLFFVLLALIIFAIVASIKK